MAKVAFHDLDVADEVYAASVQSLQQDLDLSDFDLPVQTIDRDLLPNFLFVPPDLSRPLR